ncbi:MAG: DUF1501 domain-containing protein [Oligoflexales bacterium]
MKNIGALGAQSLIPKGFAQPTQPPFLMVVHCSGGWDSSMVFETTQSPLRELEPGQQIDTSILPYVKHSSRPSVDQFFSRWGQNACVVNGIHCPSLQQEEARRFSDGVLHSDSKRWVSWPAFYAYRAAPSFVLPHVVFGSQMMPGHLSGYTQLWSDDLFETPSQNTAFSEQELSLIDLYTRKNYSNLLSQYSNHGLSTEKMKIVQKARKAEAEFKLIRESQDFLASDSLFLKRAKLACDMFSENRTIAASIEDHRSWDIHADHDAQQAVNFESLFQDLVSLFQYADSLDLLKRMIVVVKSEMGRNPVLNSLGSRSHWPVTSCLLWGESLRGGQSFGGVTENCLEQPLNFLLGSIDETYGVSLQMKNIFAALFLRWIGPQNPLMKNVSPASFLIDFEGV